ncbi:MAG: IPT/TIG domain-containing protein, partial [Pseudomonadota bacterium]
GPGTANAGGLVFEFQESDLAVQALAPRLGPVHGGTEVKITGAGMRPGTSCVFGDVRVRAAVVSPEEIRCVAPAWVGTGAQDAGPGGATTLVQVEGPGAAAAPLAALAFRYHAAVELRGVSPSSVPDSGGARLRLAGAGFVSTADAACRFLPAGTLASAAGAAVVTPAIVVDPSTVECWSPRLVPGTYSLAVALNGQDFTPG